MKRKTLLIIVSIVIVVIIVIAVMISNYNKKKQQQLLNSYVAGSNTPVVIDTKKAASVFPLKKGSTGKAVKLIQISAGTDVDGIFGPITEQKVKARFKTGEVTIEAFKDLWIDRINNFLDAFPLKKGDKSNWVKALNVLIDNEKADNVFDDNTLQKVQKLIGREKVSAIDFTQLIVKQLNF